MDCQKCGKKIRFFNFYHIHDQGVLCKECYNELIDLDKKEFDKNLEYADKEKPLFIINVLVQYPISNILTGGDLLVSSESLFYITYYRQRYIGGNWNTLGAFLAGGAIAGVLESVKESFELVGAREVTKDKCKKFEGMSLKERIAKNEKTNSSFYISIPKDRIKSINFDLKNNIGKIEYKAFNETSFNFLFKTENIQQWQDKMNQWWISK